MRFVICIVHVRNPFYNQFKEAHFMNKFKWEVVESTELQECREFLSILHIINMFQNDFPVLQFIFSI